MTSASLFGKLQEHELELGRLEKHENQEKKSKGVALKVYSKEDRNDGVSEEDENFMLLIKRLGKFFSKNDKPFNAKRNKHFRKRKASTSTQEVTCLFIFEILLAFKATFL